MRYSDWSNFDKSNDFSQPATGQPGSADRIAVFNAAGKLLMGDVPDGPADGGLGTYTIRVRARGTSGQEVINLTVGGTTVKSWALSTGFNDYVVNTALGGGINVVYGNDARTGT